MTADKGNAPPPQLIVVGLNAKHHGLLRQLAQRWRTHIIEKGDTPPQEGFLEHESLVYISGDASSFLVWQEMALDGLVAIVSTVTDFQLNHELCHILFDRLGLKMPFFILADDLDAEGNQKLKERYGVRLISPWTLAQEVLFNHLLTRTSLPLNIGLGKGEILEVEISARSHLVERKLRHLRPKEWHIAAIYRKGRLLLPTGEETLNVGDRVVLVGDPTVLANLADALLKGEPQFPNPYGSWLTLPLQPGWQGLLDEVGVWVRHCPVAGIHAVSMGVGGESVLPQAPQGVWASVNLIPTGSMLRDYLAQIPSDSGLMVLPRRFKGWRRFFRLNDGGLNLPLLLASERGPYTQVVAGLDGDWPDLALDIALDVSRELNLPLEAYVTKEPWEIGGDESVRRLRQREGLVNDLSTIHGLKLPLRHFTGNPVSEAVGWLNASGNPLLVITYRPGEYSRWILGRPVLAALLCERFQGSVLLVPIPASADSKE